MMTRVAIDNNLTGFVTLPTEAGIENELVALLDLWKADAVRDSDGTSMPAALAQRGLPVYSTICLVRADQDYARANPARLACKYLLSEPRSAVGTELDIRLMQGYSPEKYRVNVEDDPARWWEVVDRTTGTVVDPALWRFDAQRGVVTVGSAEAFHMYTVSFLAWITWDSTSMYNHRTNKWTGPHVTGVDPYFPDTWRHLMGYFDAYLDRIPNTEVVRLTTLAYHFVIDADESGKDRFRDWHGYGESVSPAAMADFQKQFGYALRPEDFVDAGYYNASYRVPSKAYRDWMAFVHAFVLRFGKELVQKIHARGKKAAIFWGDHWVGVEPYSPDFQGMGIDINIGACEDGLALRRLADSPGPQTKEIRLYPYFFPDVFRDGGNPTLESQRNWAKIRRALFRRLVDRIGHGGYPKLALKFPEFVSHVGQICDEFRMIKQTATGGDLPISAAAPFTHKLKVAVIDAWGSLRAWINHGNMDQKFHTIRPDTFEVAGSNALECLAGLPVDVVFLSLDEIAVSGIPPDVDLLLNEGSAGTAWSGGEYWTRPEIVTAVRRFVYEGGAFVGIGDPCTFEFQGSLLQLSDVLGVQKENGQSINGIARPIVCVENKDQGGNCETDYHFITKDTAVFDPGVEKSWVFPVSDDLQVLAAKKNHVHLAARGFGRGRAVYVSALPYSAGNSRILYRSLLWATRKEAELGTWFSDNPNVDCVAWPARGMWAAANSSDLSQKTSVQCVNRSGALVRVDIELVPYECAFYRIEA